MKTEELRKQLKIKGLNTKGLKADLLKRLKDHCADERKNRLSYQLKNNVDEEEDCPEGCLCGIEKMEEEELKELLESDGLNVEGTKDELVLKLIDKIKEQSKTDDEDTDDETYEEDEDNESQTENIEIQILKKPFQNKSDATQVGQKRRGKSIIYNFMKKFNNEIEAHEALLEEKQWVKSK
jgi:hypothetical protein